MSIIDSLEKRRSIYQIDKHLPVPQEQVVSMVEQATALVPDAFNMKSARVVVALGAQQDRLWDTIYEVFGGKVPREKVNGFKNGAGTILYFIDMAVVEGMQKQFPLYAANFPIWAQQANGMLQLSIWSALRDMDIGANLQHYNPVIDQKVKELFKVPEHYQLVAQMPFGGIVALPDAKPAEDIALRVSVKA